MKKYCIAIACIYVISGFAQNEKENTMPDPVSWKIELLFTQDIFNTSYGKNYGFVFKGKKVWLDKNHFTLLYGAAFQNSYISESDNLFTDFVDGYTRDIGAYGVFDISYYPFRKKRFYLSLEPFIGATHLKSKGQLYIPEYSVSEKYKNTYTYFNYGFTQSLGYTINRFSIIGFSWISLKGILDEGRSRPADFDSRLFLGLGVGYTF
ncbi:hypothetical protein ACSTS3_22175 [Aquimarina muelleri]|uniref:hypothetical protein n=1 Tax=Aquimarina muelleri TaxID=279356 RepID=UPI003F687FEB